ncbi:MAG: hypothetical protein ABSG21_10020 [Spirochaetia bacterium]|jgi:hypothetical protein
MKSQKLELWKRRRKAFEKSGSTRRAFCAKNHLKLSTLDYWFSRIRDAERSHGLIELKAQAIPTVTSCLEVVVADKYRVEIREGFNVQLFGEIVKALESLG